jgi:hypothetical protein
VLRPLKLPYSVTPFPFANPVPFVTLHQSKMSFTTSPNTSTWSILSTSEPSTPPNDWEEWTNPANPELAFWGDSGATWPLDWELDIYVLAPHGSNSYWVHYDHWEYLDTWKYIPIEDMYPGWALKIPGPAFVEANLEARG